MMTLKVFDTNGLGNKIDVSIKAGDILAPYGNNGENVMVVGPGKKEGWILVKALYDSHHLRKDKTFEIKFDGMRYHTR
jgi:hypothetical protein